MMIFKSIFCYFVILLFCYFVMVAMNMIQVSKLKSIGLLSCVLSLVACGGSDDSSTSTDNSSNDAAVDLAIQAQDITSKASVGEQNTITVQAQSQQDVEIKHIEQVNKNEACQVSHISGLTYQLKSDVVGVCTYQYQLGPVSSAYRLSDDSSNIAQSRVAVSANASDPNLPLSSAVTFVGQQELLDLPEILGADYPEGYTLDSAINLLGEVNNAQAEAYPQNNSINFTSTKAGVYRIYYSLSNDTAVKLGSIDVAVSEVGNHAPVAEDFNYTESYANNMPTRQGVIIHIDLSSKISDVDGSDSLSLVNVLSQNNVITNIDSENLTFDFESSTSGMNQVGYVVSDGHGGYATGIVTIEVDITGDAFQPWTGIDTTSTPVLSFSPPPSENSAKKLNLDYSDLVLGDGVTAPKGVSVVRMTLYQAQKYCVQRNMRLPIVSELGRLYSDTGNVFDSHNWPAGTYWTNQRDSETSAFVVNLVGNTQTSMIDTSLNYVTCVAVEPENEVYNFSATTQAQRDTDDNLIQHITVAIYQPDGSAAPYLKLRVETLNGTGIFEVNGSNNSALYQADADGMITFNYISDEYAPETLVMSLINYPITTQTIIASWSYDAQTTDNILVYADWYSKQVKGTESTAPYVVSEDKVALVVPKRTDVIYKHRRKGVTNNISAFYKMYHAGSAGAYAMLLDQPDTKAPNATDWEYNDKGIPTNTHAYGIYVTYAGSSSTIQIVEDGILTDVGTYEVVGNPGNFVWFTYNNDAKQLDFYIAKNSVHPKLPTISVSTDAFDSSLSMYLAMTGDGSNAGGSSDEYIIQQFELSSQK